MELEMGLKITQTRGDLTSTTNFQMVKDPSGPIFMSRETETKFILTAHVKGFGKEPIEIKINEDGTQIVIRMERPVQVSGWSVHKKEVEMQSFIKAFRIPSGVVLDRIKAKFNDRDSVLTILMPKSEKGICGARIEEAKEFLVDQRESGNKVHNMTQEKPYIVGDQCGTTKETTYSQESKQEENARAELERESKEEKETSRGPIGEGGQREFEKGKETTYSQESKQEENARAELERESEEEKAMSRGPIGEGGQREFEKGKETTLTRKGHEEVINNNGGDSSKNLESHKVEKELEAITGLSTDENHGKDEEVEGGSEEEKLVDQEKEDNSVEADHSNNNYSKKEENNTVNKNKGLSRKFKLCKPCVIAGSSILVSLVVIAIHWIRSKKRKVQ